FNTFSDLNATWSPDGTRLAFRSTRGNNRDIYVINVDGTGEQRLTTDPASDFAADWSPDGTKIAFTSLRSGHSAGWVMNADGTGAHQLPADAQEAALRGWSPDGTKIMYDDGFCDTCGESDVFVMNADGTGVTQVTDTPLNELAKSWSRTGARAVADLSTLTPSGTRLSKGDIAVIDVATGATTNLTNTAGINEEHPDWSPVSSPAVAEPALALTPAEGGRATAGGLEVRLAPAPGRGSVTLGYVLPNPGHVRLGMYDVTGQLVVSLVDSWQSAGNHVAVFSAGHRSGVFFYRLEWEGSVATGKIPLMP